MRYVLKRISLLCGIVGLLVLTSWSSTLLAAEVLVAVASNFSSTMQEIAERFQQETGHEVKLAFGSSGKLAAQVQQGAPFEVLLSADSSKPAFLVEQGLAVADTVMTYAHGRLVLWSAHEGYVDEMGDVLLQGDFRHLALANARLAPYGEAAQQVLTTLNLHQRLAARMVTGENIAQTFQFVQTGNAELGFVALSQWRQFTDKGSAWLVPTEYHAPIRQDAVLLHNGAVNPAARQLLTFLRSPVAQAIIREHGYEVPLMLARQAHAD